MILLTTDWNQLLPQLVTLWLVGWGIRALLIGLIVGGLLWFYKRTR
ncbi:hypothetical protein [Levilactobacillus cerevisiae]|nr:hypothetical protein [Levilactobacillus cerevisiae]